MQIMTLSQWHSNDRKRKMNTRTWVKIFFNYLKNWQSGIRMLKPFIFRNRFAETGFLTVTERPIVSGIIVTCRWSLHACYQSITCCFTAAVACIPDARTPSQRKKGQWHIKAVGAEGTDVMPPWADNHSYATESARQCKNGRFSLPLQCI